MNRNNFFKFLGVFIASYLIYYKTNANPTLGFSLVEGIGTFVKAKNISPSSSTQVSPNKDGQFDYLPAAGKNQIVKHAYYSLSYNEKAEQADWVAYELKKEYVKKKHYKRPFFVEDPEVKTQSASWINYKKSGYDKGHLCPAADMEFDIKAYNDTFFTSNISPQNHDFNSGIWNRLENYVRSWAVRYDSVYVITGGILNNPSSYIGAENVVVPNAFYKIILNIKNGKYKMIAFLIPNKKSNQSLQDYVVTADYLEQLTGIDFFPKIEDPLEDRLEKATDISSWLFY